MTSTTPEADASPETAEDARLATLSEDLDALSNFQRLKLLHVLTRPRYAEEIAEALGMSRQSALKHIEKLEERGFVRALNGRRASGPVIEYLVVPPKLFAVGVALNDLGKLEPEGGPSMKVSERTVVISEGAPVAASAAAGTPAHLILVNGPAAGQRFPLEGDKFRWTIGRSDDRDIHLSHDPFISGRHAEIQTGPGGHVLVDVFSANGTFLNFTRVPRGGRVPIKVGDVIGIGHTSFVYQRE